MRLREASPSCSWQICMIQAKRPSGINLKGKLILPSLQKYKQNNTTNMSKTSARTSVAIVSTESVKISAALKTAVANTYKAKATSLIAQRAEQSAWKTLGEMLAEEYNKREEGSIALKQAFEEYLTDKEGLGDDELKKAMFANSRDRSNVLTFAYPTASAKVIEQSMINAEKAGLKLRVQDELAIRRANAKVNAKGELIKLSDSGERRGGKKDAPAVTLAARLREAFKSALTANLEEREVLQIAKNILKDTYHSPEVNEAVEEEEEEEE